MKIKLAICLKAGIYQERFVQCVMKHYGKKYEFHVFLHFEELQSVDMQTFDGFLVEKGGEVPDFLAPEILSRTFLLGEEEKKLPVYELMDELEKQLSIHERPVIETVHNPQIIGIVSLTVPFLQLPYALTLCDMLAEKKKVLFLDMQEFSGFEEEGELGLEDMMTMAIKENYVRGRIQSAIGRMRGWSYVFPMKNPRCLLEVNQKMMKSLLSYLAVEQGYEAIVVNLGQTLFLQDGIKELFERIYLLCPKGNLGHWREEVLWNEERRRGEQDVLHRIHRMEIPTISCTDEAYAKLSEQWFWGTVGDAIRRNMQQEVTDG